MNDDQVFGLIMVVMLGCVVPITLAYVIPAAKARARRLGREGNPDERVVSDVEALKVRVNELEERLDFTERMLAQHREPDRLPGS